MAKGRTAFLASDKQRERVVQGLVRAKIESYPWAVVDFFDAISKFDTFGIEYDTCEIGRVKIIEGCRVIELESFLIVLFRRSNAVSG